MTNTDLTIVTLRNATHLHKCNGCGKEVLVYRDCTGEGHYGVTSCVKIINGQEVRGSWKLIKQFSVEEAKQLNLKPVFSCMKGVSNA